MTSRSRLLINALAFTGTNVRPSELVMGPGLGILYGASNTGKSFTVKAIDFMLGAGRELPDIEERREYDRAWLTLDLPTQGLVTLMRALAGGAFELRRGQRQDLGSTEAGVALSARHDSSGIDNLSQLLLNELGFGTKQIAYDANGKQRSLSFRDLSRFCIVDETTIQSEVSPALSGQFKLSVAERSVFRLLLSGTDDSAIVPQVDRKTFRASTTGKLEVLDEMISAVEDELSADFPNADQFSDQNERLEDSWKRAQSELQTAQESIRSFLDDKRKKANALSLLQSRRAEIEITIGRFQQLQRVYQSDTERLEAIDEAGFLLALGQEKDCPLCGAPAKQHKKAHGLEDVERARNAAVAEVSKLRLLSADLEIALKDLAAEQQRADLDLEKEDAELIAIEHQLRLLAPAADKARLRVHETQALRDHVRSGMSLIERKKSLAARRAELAALKPASKANKPSLVVPSASAHEFAQKVSEVLLAWKFPGECHVSFEEQTCDLMIDGKRRRDNGKGVRAITHAAFKTALLLYCAERNLPHPGFLVLDTPLLTYRDPLASRAGPLSSDEQLLRETSLKEHFFDFLAKNSDKGQFIVVENIDLPPGIEKLAHLVTFTGASAEGRKGLFLDTR